MRKVGRNLLFALMEEILGHFTDVKVPIIKKIIVEILHDK